MRTTEEMMDLILTKAENDEKIRAVMMNGSRVNPNATKDRFQDFDIVYVVSDLESYTNDHAWIDYFGERIIMQMPDEMILPPASGNDKFVYLMLFEDGNRIDLTLVSIDLVGQVLEKDSLSEVLIDKDNLFKSLPPANDSDYLITKPTSKLFTDCCNEFWWVSTYVAKGLWREELSYTKYCMEVPVRNMLIRMLEWHIGTQTNFNVSSGKSGKLLEQYLSVEEWEKFVRTYPDGDYSNIWTALFTMCELFLEVSESVAVLFNYKSFDAEGVYSYLRYVEQLHINKKV
ncbi:aminoglycoside 6-adenylyltransferase [Virgibacillus sp. DJP39]|uniref:aminoglycoside 6-adenylyltransferase n=1 Tax=Virgibacillus sp. DJP39 TaxID=3409790 RepID=UPI003BB6A579